MKIRILSTTLAMLAMSGVALAQTDPHHPGGDAAQASTAAPAADPMPGTLPEQCAAMMPMMQQMMPMMQKMMPMMEKMGEQGGTMKDMPMAAAGMSEATKAYMDAMKKMDAPMMQGIQSADPDVAFVQAMIPHHQGAIDMAKAVLQFGKDDQVKAWANQIITAQQAEIAAMQEWLKQHAN
jgi:uncharacterized protein (DUF305 family)